MSKKRIITLILFFVGVNVMFAQDIIKDASKAYDSDKFDEAIELYEKASVEMGTSSELYYNLGNCHYRLGNIGEAILNYERSLKLNPNNADARTNLEFVKEKANVVDSAGESFIVDAIMGVVTHYSSNTWAMLSVVLFVLIIVCLLAYIFMDNITIRKIGFFGGAILIVVFVLTLISAFYVKNKSTKVSEAIVVVPSSTLSTSPRIPKDKTEEAFLLNEGYKVEIVDSVRNGEGKDAIMWYDVQTSDHHRAWIKSTDVEII